MENTHRRRHEPNRPQPSAHHEARRPGPRRAPPPAPRRRMTQGELAGDRFSKEYVSQIERGKTRPTAETIDWLAQRLHCDAGFLANGVSTDERGRVEARSRAEALMRSTARRRSSCTRRRGRPSSRRAPWSSRRACSPARHARWRSRAGPRVGPAARAGARARRDRERLRRRARRGRLRARRRPLQAFEHLDGARALQRRARARRAVGPPVGPAPFQDPRGALAVLPQAARLPGREGRRRAGARARSRGRRPAGDGARVLPGLGARDARATVLARKYAEQAKSIYEDLAEHRHVGRLHNNIGAFTFMLGKPDEAIPHLKEAFRIALDMGNDADAAQAVSSLAQVHLRHRPPRAGRGAVAPRAASARGAGRLLGRDRQRTARPRSLIARAGSARRCSGAVQGCRRDVRAALVGQSPRRSMGRLGDLATRRGDDRDAAHQYRRAAEALQDFRF